MAPIRLRHPKGVSTIHVDIDVESTTVKDLQQAILAATEIPHYIFFGHKVAYHYAVKSGYPPRALPLIPPLPVSSLGLRNGDQLIVTQTSGSGMTHAHPQPAAPLPAPGSGPPISQPGKQAMEDDYVQAVGGALMHRVVPDDNSCLFSSIGVVFEQDMGAVSRLRQLVADTIRNDPENYSGVMLGRPRGEYIRAILSPNSWGGAIELSNFAAHYRPEISSIDVESGRVDRFGEGASYHTRAILLDSGIHYDATSLAPTPGAPLDFHETLFPVDNVGILASAQEPASRLRAQKKLTNTATFLLKCEICGKGLKGEQEARDHAGSTGHAQFGEYS